MAEIKYIPVKKLWQHPDNPRKDLGDVTELAESIKVNGVLQNLTVVPLIGEITKKWDGESYRVIIGHRRLAAAKLAGLEELPCVVVEMSEREQLSTMLTENMQRSDLTVYEQAQGFQMMLDMGDTVEDIAEKSGFSATTVRRRVKLLELDKDKFKKSEERGVSLFEYMELDKLKSPERKNEMLDYIGTENFKYKLKQAINDEAAEARKALWVEQLSTFATQITDKTGYKRVNSFYTNGEVKVDRPEDADTIEYFFFVETWGYIVLMVKDEPSKRYSGRLELKLNAAAKRMPKWVSVKERLPEDRSDVLVVAYWHERWGVYMGWCATERAKWSVHIGIGDRDDVAVTYWMPLPEPPKEDDRND